MNYKLETYQQFNKRLDRQGQTRPVVINHIIVKGTMDEDVLGALQTKADNQDALMKAIKARKEKYTGMK
jgi:SNF2 family DNA or RNA helicase